MPSYGVYSSASELPTDNTFPLASSVAVRVSLVTRGPVDVGISFH